MVGADDDREFELAFSTSLDGVWPFELVPIGGGRYALAGQADADKAPTRQALYEDPRGKRDAYLMILRQTR